MCVNGSLIRSSTCRSSSVSAPCISSSICLPSSLERSRTMRGSFCQALPIGCMRVFMTPSCSSAVTLDSRCSGTLNSVSSLRRDISRSWLRVKTSSETIVIRCSSVSTLTRIDWLAILSASCTSPSAADLGAGFALACFAAGLAASGAGCLATGAGAGAGAAVASVSVSRKARSRSSRETSPGRSWRSSTCSTSVPLATSVVASGCTGGAATTGIGAATASASAWWPPSAISCSFSIRSSSVPSGSVSVASRPAKISLMRSMLDRISVTASALTGMPSRNLPISVSPAWASASSRGSPRKPHVPLMVWTRRKMLSKIFASLGSCSNSRWSRSKIPATSHP
jgi:hypothetical protein